jgi:S-adenosylhomocysteine hydrolase
VLSGSNPFSTRDEICASLALHDRMEVFARYGEDSGSYYDHLRSVCGAGA